MFTDEELEEIYELLTWSSDYWTGGFEPNPNQKLIDRVMEVLREKKTNEQIKKPQDFSQSYRHSQS